MFSLNLLRFVWRFVLLEAQWWVFRILGFFCFKFFLISPRFCWHKMLRKILWLLLTFCYSWGSVVIFTFFTWLIKYASCEIYLFSNWLFSSADILFFLFFWGLGFWYFVLLEVQWWVLMGVFWSVTFLCIFFLPFYLRFSDMLFVLRSFHKLDHSSWGAGCWLNNIEALR